MIVSRSVSGLKASAALATPCEPTWTWRPRRLWGVTRILDQRDGGVVLGSCLLDLGLLARRRSRTAKPDKRVDPDIVKNMCMDTCTGHHM